MSKRSVQYEKVGVRLFDKDDPFTVELAKSYLGWETEYDGSEDGKTKTQDFKTAYTFRDKEGNKVRLQNNKANRPFRLSLALRYANEILRKKWGLNSQCIGIDKYGWDQNGAHRMAGVVLAEQVRKQNPEYWKKTYGWRGPVSIEIFVITGLDPKFADTEDIGQNRKLGDVLFRHSLFSGTEQEQKKLSNVLSAATRLVWLRTGGMTVTDAPHFPHSEALDFLNKHPRLQEAVKVIEECDGGQGVEGKQVSSFLSLGYASALMYLMGMSATDPIKYQESGELDDSKWEDAEMFWTIFAGGEQSMHPLRKALTNISGSGGMGRDEIVGTVIKAYNLWAEGQEVTGKDIKVKRTTDKDSGKIKLSETPRLGGLDTEPERFEDEPADQNGEDVEPGNNRSDESAEGTETEPETKPKRSRKPKAKTSANGKGKRSRRRKSEPVEEAGEDDGTDHNGSTYEWEEGMEVTVDDGEGTWDGTIVELPGDGTVRIESDGAVYEARVEHLKLAETAAA